MQQKTSCPKDLTSTLARYIDITDAPVMGSGHIANPQVSIILPTFSRGRTGTLHMAIESVLAQSFGELELIVIDDGSTDGTAEVIRRYAERDNRVVHVRYERNCGFPAPRMNAGMLIARGKYIGFVFDDGLLYQHAVEKLYLACREHPNTVCYGLCNEYRGSNVMTWGFAFSKNLLRHKNLIPNNAVLFPREIAEQCGGYDHNVLLKRVNDWDLWRRYSQAVSFHRISDIVAEEHGPNQADSLENAVTLHHDMAARLIRVDRGDKLLLSGLSERNVYGLDDLGENPSVEDLVRAFELFAEHARSTRDEEAAEFFEQRHRQAASSMAAEKAVLTVPPRTLRVCHLRSGSEEDLTAANRAEDAFEQLAQEGELEFRRVAQQRAHHFLDAFDWLSFDIYVFDWPVDEMGLALMEGLHRFGRAALLNLEDPGELTLPWTERFAAAVEVGAATLVPNTESAALVADLKAFPSNSREWLKLLQDCAGNHSRPRDPAMFNGGLRGAVGPNRYAAREEDQVTVGDFIYQQARELNTLRDHRGELGALNYILRVNPGHIPAALDRADLLRKATKFGVALERLRPTLALHPENHDVAVRAMELALELNDRQQAARVFSEYLTKNLEGVRGGEPEPAAASAERTYDDAEPNQGKAVRQFKDEAFSMMERGDSAKARSVLLRALYEHPMQPESYVLYGDYHFRAEDYDAVARGYFAALCFGPEIESAASSLQKVNELRGEQRGIPVRDEPEFSVLINTWNRAGWLRKCLAGYCVQTFSPDRFEIVIVDDGSEDDTRAVVESFQPYLNIRYVRHEHSGMAISRTLLVKHARGPLVGFFDDDDVVAPTCVEEHWRAHREHPDPQVAVLGYSEWCPGLKVSPLMHYVTGVGRQYVDYPSLTHGQFYDFRCFWGGRSSCKRALIESSELFDPQFTWGYEDIELMYRLSKRGRPVRVFYNQNAVHRFMQPMNLEAFLGRSERQGRTAHFFFSKHPDTTIKQYLPIDDAAMKWANLVPVYDEWVKLAHKLERVVAESFSQSFDSEICRELFLVYGKLHDAAWARGVIAGRKEKLEPEIQEARTSRQGPRILILDEVLAVPDRTAGALRMHHLVELLRSLGCRITYGAYLAQGFDDHADRLNKLGVRTVYLGGAWGNARTGGNNETARAHEAIEEISALDETYDIVWICFHWLARIYLPLIRLNFPEAKILVDSVDLHYIREARAARVAGGRKETMSAYATRVMELTTYACADAVGVVTDVEKERLSLDLARTRVFTLPTVHDPLEVTAGRSGRQGLVFVGSFWHEPNVDAMVWFVKEVYPLIAGRHPGIDLYIVGQEPPNNVKALASRHVHIRGWVPDTAPHLNRAAVSIAPLRYGSGMKGKIGEALSFGVPVVTTSVGAEGFGIVNGVHALVADTPEEFAQAVCRVMGDEVLWERLSGGGKQLLEERWSSAQMRERLETLLSELLTGARTAASVTAQVRTGGSLDEPGPENPQQAVAYKEALNAAGSGEMDRAVQLLTTHLNERSDHAGGWSDLGVLLYHKGDHDEARRCFETALVLPGGWRTLACENLVECLLASNERERAELLAQRWIDKGAGMPEAWLLWARFKNEEGDLVGTRDAVQHALSIDPANEVARSYLAEIDQADGCASAVTERTSAPSADSEE